MPLYDLLKEDALFGYEHIEKLIKLLTFYAASC